MKIKPYFKKNNDLMFYINDYERNISLGYGETIYSTKLTKGQKSLLSKFFEALKNSTPDVENFKKIKEHTEAKAKLHNGLEFFITDIAEVCGNTVANDGAYILYNNNLYNINNIK